MKKSLLILLCAVPCLVNAQDKFKISGNLLKSGSDKKVILNYVNSEGKNVKDSTMLKGGKFTFNGTTAFGNKAYLALMPVKTDSSKGDQQPDYQDFYLEKGDYKVLGADSMAKAKITGAEVQTEYLLFNSQMDPLLTRYRAMTSKFLKARSANDSVMMKNIQTEAKPLVANMNKVLDSFILTHPDSYVSLDLVSSEKATIIDPKVFDTYYKPFSKRVLASFAGQKLTEKYDKAKQLFIGRTLDFVQTDNQGNAFKLSSLRGKYVLVDFWASWCAPCRAENPNLLKAYKELKGKNFEIVGVSLDETKAAWLKAVDADAMPWVQVSDLKGFKNEVAVKFAITAIPQNVLIDPQGVIIAKDLRGDDVNAKLSAFIK